MERSFAAEVKRHTDADQPTESTFIHGEAKAFPSLSRLELGSMSKFETSAFQSIQIHTNQSDINKTQRSIDHSSAPASSIFPQTTRNKQGHRLLENPNPQLLIDFPRYVRISSEHETVEQMQRQYRQQKVMHHNFMPELENKKSMKIFEGVYLPNEKVDCESAEMYIHEFIKRRGNFNKGEPPEESIFSNVPVSRKFVHSETNEADPNKKLR